MDSEPIKRLLGIEMTAIVTGRADQYHEVTLEEALTTALNTQRDEMRKKVGGLKVEKFYAIAGEKPNLCEIYNQAIDKVIKTI